MEDYLTIATMPGSIEPPLTLYLFGPFEGRLHGAPLPRLRSRKGRWLLALLALRHGRGAERDWLAGTLWPESTDAQAAQNLRMALTDLRRALGPEADRLRSVTRRTLCLDLAGAEVDALAFDAAVVAGTNAALEEAVALYRGPLLEGCVEEWVLPERQVREEAFLKALDALAAQALTEGDSATAERYLRRAVAVDPLREGAQRRLMEALAAGGSYGAALAVYRELRQRLHHELNAAPDAETQSLFETLRSQAQRLASSPRRGQISEVVAARPSSTSAPLTVTDQREAGAGNLPLPLTRFIGREQALADLKRWLGKAHSPPIAAAGEDRLATSEAWPPQAGSPRLLTLTGAGGCGKTRLALRAATDLQDGYADGVWLIELAALADPELVQQTVAQTLGLREQPEYPLGATLVDHLRSRSLLLILDNCEHLLSACAHLADHLLRACPDLRILATSRERLGVEGEQTYRVTSLSLPAAIESPRSVSDSHPSDLSTLHSQFSTLLASEAAQLFVDRARMAQPTFAVSALNAAAVAQICRQLDGIPLALELAAAWVRVMPVKELAARLDDHCRILKDGSRISLPRHQTLRALIDWSYCQLSEPEQRLLQRLSVFAGGWTLEAAEAVCGDEPGEHGGGAVGVQVAGSDTQCPTPQRPEEVLDLLTALVDKSLVEYEEREGEARYRLLETVRQYARDRLGEEEVEAGRRHRDWFLSLAEAAELKLRRSAEEFAWTERLEREHDNLRAALAWSLADPKTDAGGPEAGLRMAAALTRFWIRKGYLSEARKWFEVSLSRGLEVRGPARGRALIAASSVAEFQDDGAGVMAFTEEALALARETDDRWLLAIALRGSAAVALFSLGDRQRAMELAEESLVLAEELADPWILAHALMGLGDIALDRDDFEAAARFHRESLERFQEIEDRGGVANQLYRLGQIAQSQGQYERARTLYEERMPLSAEMGDKPCVLRTLLCLGELELIEHDWRAARARFEGVLALSQELGEKVRIGVALDRLGHVAREEGDLALARTFAEESLTVLREVGHLRFIPRALLSLGQVARLKGEFEEARTHFTASLTLCRETPYRESLAVGLEEFAGLAAAQGDAERAARLFGAAEALREAPGVLIFAGERMAHEADVVSARAALGPDAFLEAWRAGRAMPLQQAIKNALDGSTTAPNLLVSSILGALCG
jgi:predicted ATPase/DNA-binding SARP family transcriptional activator/uncharacterized protein HemY